jgi:hypothetical protein
MKPEIIITITRSGEIFTEVCGVKGKKCVSVTSFIDALGEPARTFKPEYYNCSSQTIKQHIVPGKRDNPGDAV